MTVRENLELGAYQRNDTAGIAEDLDRSYGLFPRLKERESQKAGTLSGGEQQMCAIGRALMARPRLLLLDEPSMGLAPILVDRIFEIIVEINKQGTTVLVVEQNASIALSVANRGYVLETGEIKLSDDAACAARERRGAQALPRRGLGRASGGCAAASAAASRQARSHSRSSAVVGLELQPGAPRAEPARRDAHDAHGDPGRALVVARTQVERAVERRRRADAGDAAADAREVGGDELVAADRPCRRRPWPRRRARGGASGCAGRAGARRSSRCRAAAPRCAPPSGSGRRRAR